MTCQNRDQQVVYRIGRSGGEEFLVVAEPDFLVWLEAQLMTCLFPLGCYWVQVGSFAGGAFSAFEDWGTIEVLNNGSWWVVGPDIMLGPDFSTVVD